MDIKGIQKTSLVDFPGKISTVIFFGGCNFLCGFCHNSELVYINDNSKSYPDTEILGFLRERSKLIDSVVITGGEPTLYKNIDSFIQRIKEIPLYIKIDTNGSNPAVIERLLNKKLLDYIAIDIKTSPEKYELAAGVKVNTANIKNTVELAKNSGIDYELRTTCVPTFVDLDDFEKIQSWIGHVKRYYIQQFVNKSTLDPLLLKCIPYSDDKLNEFKKIVETFADECEIRGM
jgi:pyruvate formate lyase activating enzyme